MKGFIIPCFFLVLSFLSAGDLNIGVGVNSESPLFQNFVNLFNEIESRSQGEVSFLVESMTLERCRFSLLHNQVDGDAGRTVFVYEGESGVLKVEPPLFVNRYYVFGKPGLEIDGLESLKKYSMAVVKGNIIISRFAEKNALDSLTVDENEDGLRMILYDRVDYILATDLEQGMLKNDEFRDEALMMYDTEIFRENIYLFLSERNIGIHPLLEEILQDLSVSGKLRKILGNDGT